MVNLLTNGEKGDWCGDWSTDVAGEQWRYWKYHLCKELFGG